MRFTIKKFYWIDITILILALIVTLLGLGSYGLYEPHEGHFAMVSQEMIWRNDWITPHLNGSPYLNKPPLMYWLIATTTNMFGSTEFAARLPVGLMGWLGIVVSWKWARELWGINSSRIAALMLSVTLGWFIFTHQILIDVVLGTLLLSSNYFLWRSLYQPRSRINWFGAYCSLALCILTKGLIGIVFPFLGCTALIIVRKDLKIVRQIRLYQGLLFIGAIILPWFITVEQANPGFLHYFIVNEHFDRLLDRRFPPDYEVSKISAVGYLGITACWCFPWVLFLPSVIKSTWKEWQRGFFKNASIGDRKNSDGIFLLSMATMLPILLFLPLSSRLIYYSIPAIPAYIILCAGWWDKFNRKPQPLQAHSTIVDYPSENNISYRDSGDISPVATLCKSPVQIFESSAKVQNINLYSIVNLALGIGFYVVILTLPMILKLLPTVMQNTEISTLIIVVAISLGTGWLASAIGILKRSNWALVPLFIVLTITYLATIRGFYLYQDLRSSKTLVQQANTCLNSNTLWTFEGSREIGAAGAIGYYLNQGKTADKSINSSLGWAVSKGNNYRNVMVLSDSGKNRLPPQFPGSTPEYLITQTQLQQYWDSDRPTVFLTDFLRSPQDRQDPISLNLPEAEKEPYLVNGQRRLYLNQAANQLASQQCH